MRYSAIRRDKEQTIDHENLDKLVAAEWSGDAKQNARDLTKDFAEYLEEQRDQIEALTIFYSQPARRSQITYAMIKAVFDAIKTDRPKLEWREHQQAGHGALRRPRKATSCRAN